MKKILQITAIAGLTLVAACGSPQSPTTSDIDASQQEDKPVLHIYSARHYDSDKILYDAFEQEAGVKIQVRESKADQLLEAMKVEGAQSPADLLIASDAGALWRFQAAGLTQPVQSETLETLIPASFRQEDGHWFGLARRLRLVAYDPERISPDQVDAWSDLADPSLEGEICVRTSSNIYNLSLMGEMIERLGAEAAQAWAKQVANNMARAPQGGDTDQIRAVAAGQCGVAITNHYYWVRLTQSASQADRDVAASTVLSLPAFEDGAGAHVNITGAAVAATAEDPELAAQFIAFLLTPRGQELLTVDTGELPLSDAQARPAGADQIPAFQPGTTPLEAFGENQAEAQRLYDLAGWN